jgi:hypothetical protein
MKTVFMLGVGCLLLLATGASAAPSAVPATDANPLIVQVQDRGDRFDRSDRGWSRDRDRDQRRWSRDDDDDDGQSDGRGPGGSAMGLSGRGDQGHGHQHMMMMHKQMMGHAGGAHFHLRRGDSEIRVRCPADTQLNECIDAISRMLDRLSSSNLGGSGSPGTGSGTGTGSTPGTGSTTGTPR